MALLFARGRLSIYGSAERSVQQVLNTLGIVVKPPTREGAVLAYFPETYPRDRADRLIGATANCEGLAPVTEDESIRNSQLLATIW
jgi:PIN domain nuclease of toxin-antitoxin system